MKMEIIILVRCFNLCITARANISRRAPIKFVKEHGSMDWLGASRIFTMQATHNYFIRAKSKTSKGMDSEQNTSKMERSIKDSSRKTIAKNMGLITTSTEIPMLESGIEINVMGKALRGTRMDHVFKGFGKMTKNMEQGYSRTKISRLSKFGTRDDWFKSRKSLNRNNCYDFMIIYRIWIKI